MVNEMMNELDETVGDETVGETLNGRVDVTASTGETLLVFSDGGRYAREFQRELTDRLDPIGKLAVRHVDVWSTGSAAVAHRVTSLPTAVLVRDGDECARLVGPASRRRIDAFAISLGAEPRRQAVATTAAFPTAVAGR